MTATELRDLILRQLARENGGGTMRWRKVLGDLKTYPRATHAHCNWEARPGGPGADVAIVERVIDRVRLDHPYITD